MKWKEIMKRNFEICKNCSSLVTQMGSVMWEGEPTLCWMMSCEKCKMERPMHECDFEKVEVTKDCELYAEYCLKEWNGKQ